MIIEDEGLAGRPESVIALIYYKEPDSAAHVRVHFHNDKIDGQSFYVTNYELPEIHKQQIENKDKADSIT